MNSTNDNSSLNVVLTLYTIANTIDFYFSAIVIPIGIILNLATILIFARSSSVTHKNVILNLMYIGLGMYDILALFNSILFVQLLPSQGIYLVNYSQAACIVFSWWRKVVGQSPSWVQVIITFERYFNVLYANGISIFRSKRNVIGMLVSVFFLLTVVNMGQAWFYDSNVCTPTSDTVLLITDIVYVLFRFLLPFCFMIVLNILLSKHLYDSKKKITMKNRSFKHERHYTITVIGFNVIFFAFNLPWAVYYILSYFQSCDYVVFDAYLDVGILDLMNSISFSIFYLNNLSSFFLNLIFNSVFRKQFFSLTRGVWKVSHAQSSTNVNTMLQNKNEETFKH